MAILGVLRSGAAYVPVDADDPPARARLVFDRAGACCVVRDGLRIEAFTTPSGADHPLGPDRAPGLDDDAWVIFTSGSTGLSIAFDASCEEIWLAWRNGATLVPVPRSIVRAGSELGPWLAERGVTVVSTVPTLAAMWDDASLAGVRLLILGGEACPEPLGWRLAAGREVWNTYGPTEATVVTTATPIRPGEPVTIGRPLQGWEIGVVDDQGEAVPEGEPGELVIAGAGIARYLDPVLDTERFRPVPALGWERAYPTGDIVRQTDEGLVFVGRRDHQVKIGGRRIELGEIDAQLSLIAGVRAAATVVRESNAQNKLLVSYVAGEVDASDVRTAIAAQLPEALVPLIVILEELPQSASGKVDRGALPWPPPAPDAGPGPASLDGTIGWLAERWADQLGPIEITPGSDFFALGGTSLAAAKLPLSCASALQRSRSPTSTSTGGSTTSPRASTSWRQRTRSSPASTSQPLAAGQPSSSRPCSHYWPSPRRAGCSASSPSTAGIRSGRSSDGHG